MGNFPARGEQGRLIPITRTTFYGRASREHGRDEGFPPRVILVTGHVRDTKREDMKNSFQSYSSAAAGAVPEGPSAHRQGSSQVARRTGSGPESTGDLGDLVNDLKSRGTS